jgi:hypothetical protein
MWRKTVCLVACVVCSNSCQAATQGGLRITPTPNRVQATRGSALDTVRPSRVTTAMAPHQELVEMFSSVTNKSRSPVVILSVRPVLEEGHSSHAKILSVSVGKSFTGSLYGELPPSVEFEGRCLREKLRRPLGYRLEPGKRMMIATRIRAVSAGTFRYKGRIIEYRSQNRRFRQFDPFGFQAHVKRGFKRKVPAAEHRCMGGTSILPQG